MHTQFDAVVIGAGPSGSAAASLLAQKGLAVCVVEKQHFPRFVIGESLLPYSMLVLEKAGLAEAVNAEKTFQYKNGAAFSWASVTLILISRINSVPARERPSRSVAVFSIRF